MTRSGGIHIPYMVWLSKTEIYPLHPQNLKICITAYGNFEVPLKIRAKCLHQTGGFRGQANGIIQISVRPTPTLVAMETSGCHLDTKYRRYIGDITKILAPNRLVGVSADLTVYK